MTRIGYRNINQTRERERGKKKESKTKTNANRKKTHQKGEKNRVNLSRQLECQCSGETADRFKYSNIGYHRTIGRCNRTTINYLMFFG